MHVDCIKACNTPKKINTFYNLACQSTQSDAQARTDPV